LQDWLRRRVPRFSELGADELGEVGERMKTVQFPDFTSTGDLRRKIMRYSRRWREARPVESLRPQLLPSPR
jgi:hypothetical protein